MRPPVIVIRMFTLKTQKVYNRLLVDANPFGNQRLAGNIPRRRFCVETPAHDFEPHHYTARHDSHYEKPYSARHDSHYKNLKLPPGMTTCFPPGMTTVKDKDRYYVV
jgi:hypothetical protein